MCSNFIQKAIMSAFLDIGIIFINAYQFLISIYTLCLHYFLKGSLFKNETLSQGKKKK